MIYKSCGDGDLRVLNHSLKVPPQTFQRIVHFFRQGRTPISIVSLVLLFWQFMLYIENYYGNYCSIVVVHEASVVIVDIV